MHEALPGGLRGRLLALTLTITVLAALWLGCIAPLSRWYGDRADELQQRRMLLDRMAAVAASAPDLKLHVFGERPVANAVLEGTSDAIAGAELQTIVQNRATTVRASLASIETLPGEARGSYRRIGLRISVSAPWPVLVALLRSIAQRTDEPPAMLLDNVQFRAAPLQTRVADTPINASFTVYAFRSAQSGGDG